MSGALRETWDPSSPSATQAVASGPSSVQLDCFHRPRGEGVPPDRSALLAETAQSLPSTINPPQPTALGSAVGLSRYKQLRPRRHDCGALLRWTGGGACPYVVRAGFRKFLCDPLCTVCLNSY